MNIGMLWFDNDPRTGIQAKIDRAVVYYRSKYGNNPNLCFVHPSTLAKAGESTADTAAKHGEIEVRISASVLPNHFWIGVNGSVRPSES